MPIEYGPQSVLCQLVWESANFASGGGSTTFGLNVESASTFDLGLAATEISDAWQATIRTIQDNDITLDRVRIETVDRSLEAPVALAGSASITGPPPNVTALTSYKSFGKGRRNQGRSYWPGLLAENDIDERGVVLNTRLVTVFTQVGAFFTAVETIPEVISQSIPQSTYPEQKTPPNIPWPNVTSRQISPLVATQRRRLR